ncbi:hypothetical protein BDV96DRAFT_641714 [Lophiotrema nucula]|uniref:Uncharacterized protein n=1 Tax=Lophiotrema nucula TaxID=690887 RepID=A0A6A5ZL02_9PLEO|nr:hypothetical protein BDV96DRAFT_641714 [Lophiotrema nucula]
MAENQRMTPKSPSAMSTRKMSRELAARRASILSQFSQRRTSSGSRRGTNANVDSAIVDPNLDLFDMDFWVNLAPEDQFMLPGEANGGTFTFDSTSLDFSNPVLANGVPEQPFVGDAQFTDFNQLDVDGYGAYGNYPQQAPQMQFNPLAAIPREPALAPSPYVDPTLMVGGENFEEFEGNALFVPQRNSRKHSLSASSAGFGHAYKKARSHSQASSSRYPSSVGSKVSSHRSSGSFFTDTSSQARRRAQGKAGRNASTFADRRLQPGARPQMDPAKPWVRINATTEGKTTRTAKINRYKAEYDDCAHPAGDWNSTHYEFKYTKDGEFKDKVMRASKIKEYILEYPRNKVTDAKLIIWIQKGPTDSARRYKTTTWSKCRFAECPAQQHQTGTILHGHYRVAFDEKSHKYGTRTDPFLVSGYAHLYCMERFLDFPEIIRRADVRVDVRSLSNEPSGKFAATLAGQPECQTALTFVEAAVHGGRHGVQKEEEFRRYPRHPATPKNAPKDHFSTLTYAMTKCKADLRPPAQCKQFEERGHKATHLLVNFGDLNMLFSEVARNKRARKKQAKAKRRGLTEADDDDDDDDILAEQKKRAIKEATRNISEKAKQSGRRSSPHAGKKRKNDEVDSDSDSDSDDAFDPPARSSKRQKQFTVHDGNESDEYEEPDAPLANTGSSPRPSGQPIRRSHRQHKKVDTYNVDAILEDDFESQPANDYLPSELGQFQDDEYAAHIPDDLDDLLRANLGAYKADHFLNRRKSSTVGYGRRTSSLKSSKSSLANRKPSMDGRRVSFGGNSMLEFDQMTPIRRYSTRSHDKTQSGRVLRSHSPLRSPLKPIRE